MRPVRATLAAAVLVAASLAGAAQPVAAGCTINVTYVNLENTRSKVDERESKSKIAPLFFGTSTWKRLGTDTINVPANSERTRAYKLDFGCDVPKRYKFFLKNGGNTKVVYKPSEDDFTSKRNIRVRIDF
jgi:hypothetical protein